jgi:hypothetical protein
MPVQKSKSGLVAALGPKIYEAHEKHKNDETTFGQMELPSGIENGIARLVDCKFDIVKPGKENSGKYYFYAAAAVVFPVEHEGVKVEGMRTSITEALYDTPNASRKTVDEHYAWILNAFRQMGVDTTQLGPDDLEAAAQALKESQPFIKFRTWKGQKQTTGPYKDKDPRVMHQWNGLAEFNEDQSAAPGVDDETGPAPPTGNGAPKVGTRVPAPAQAPRPAAPAKPQARGPAAKAPPPQEEPAFDETNDLNGLLEKANAEDEAAQQELRDMAMAAGHTEEVVDNAEDWTAVVALINSPAGDSGDGAGEWEPQVEDIYLYTPKDAQGNPLRNKVTKKVMGPVECEVTAVDAAAKTATLRNNADKKTSYVKVPWAQLESQPQS